MNTGTATANGIIYGPTTAGTQYLSAYHHRNGGNYHKNHWHTGFTPSAEYALFEDTESFADQNKAGWRNVGEHLWGVHGQGSTQLGVRGERLAKFPHPQNDTDPWHGYPVSPQERQNDTPPDDVIDLWIQEGVVSRVFGARVRRRKI